MKRAVFMLCLAAGCAQGGAQQRALQPSMSPEPELVVPQPAAPETAPTGEAPAASPTETPTTVASPAAIPTQVVPYELPKFPGAIAETPGWTPPPCELETTAVVRRTGATFHVSAMMRNLTKVKLELTLPDRCPSGPANFSGLRDGYDYYAACASGACATPRPELRYTLAPGQAVEITSLEIDPKQTSCNAVLTAGHYSLGFSVQTVRRVCGGKPGEFEVVEAKAKPLPPAKPRAPCPRGPACGIACPGGRFAHDANGCSVCGCEPDPMAPTKPSWAH